MRLHISAGDGTPIYRQIINQVKYLIAAGQLSPGDEVPAIRTLAQQLLINPNTVARAYRDLEAMGMLVSRQGAGTRVADTGSPLAAKERRRILAERADALLAEARQLGFSFESLKTLLEERHARLEGADKEDSRHD